MKRVSSNEFWYLFVKKYIDEVSRLKHPNCLGPYDLADVKKLLNVEISKAPDIVSITTFSRLPRALKGNELYVIRLGHMRSRGASFIICRSSRGFTEEVFIVRKIMGREADLSIPFNKNLWTRISGISGEALATSAALKAMSTICDRYYVIPRIQSGNSRFKFKIVEEGREYEYWGQVEVDAIIFTSDDIAYVIEAKKFDDPYDGLFKYQLGFSMQTIAYKLGVEARGIIALKVKGDEKDVIKIVFVKPYTSRGNTIVINDLDVEMIIDIKQV